jgi:hypothetical protein
MTKALDTKKAKENWQRSSIFSSDLVKSLDKFSSSPCLKLLSIKKFSEISKKYSMIGGINNLNMIIQKSLLSTKEILIKEIRLTF